MTDHASTWTHERGYEHDRVDTGDVPTLAGTGMTPILIPDGAFDSVSVAERFRQAYIRMDNELAALIHDKLKNYGTARLSTRRKYSKPKGLSEKR